MEYITQNSLSGKKLISFCLIIVILLFSYSYADEYCDRELKSFIRPNTSDMKKNGQHIDADEYCDRELKSFVRPNTSDMKKNGQHPEEHIDYRVYLPKKYQVEVFSGLLKPSNAVIVDVDGNMVKYGKSEKEFKSREFENLKEAVKYASITHLPGIKKTRQAQDEIINFFDGIGITEKQVLLTSEINLAELLNKNMPEKNFIVADRNNMQTACDNFRKQKPVMSEGKPNLLIIYDQEGLKSGQRRGLDDLKLSVLDKKDWNSFSKEGTTEANIVVIVAESEGFERKFMEAGEKNLFRDKFVMFNICRSDEFGKKLIEEFGACGVICYKKEIDPVHVSKLLKKMDSIMKKSPGDAEKNMNYFIKMAIDKIKIDELRYFHEYVKMSWQKNEVFSELKKEWRYKLI